jgi:hypothetical protein
MWELREPNGGHVRAICALQEPSEPYGALCTMWELQAPYGSHVCPMGATCAIWEPLMHCMRAIWEM